MRILLIEDDRSIAPCIELMLNAESFNVCITELGEEGVVSASCPTTTSSCSTSIYQIYRVSKFCGRSVIAT